MLVNNLSDSEFFDSYCASAEIIFDNAVSSNLGIFIKDTQHVFRFVSKEYQRQLDPTGTILAEDVLKKKKTKVVSDVNIHAVREKAEAQDKEIINSRQAMLYLYVDVYSHLGIIRKCPVINPATNNVVGIIGYVTPLVLPNMLDILYRMNSITTSTPERGKPSPLKYELTPRQHMILFLSLYKYSYTEVATILTNLGYKLSSGRVNEHLENLKYIFGVKSKDALLEEAIKLKYHLYVPRKFLKVGSHPISDQIIISDS